MDDSFIWNHQSETNSWFLGLILHDPIPQSESVRVVPMIQKRMTAAVLFTCLLGIGEIHSQETSPQFKRLDRNQDGKLTKDEFSGPLFNRIDTNNDGVVSAEEDQAFSRRQPAPGRGPALRVPESVQAELDIPYAGTSNPRQRLDLYQPKTRNDNKALPVVVFIHGGGWQNGDKRGGYRMIGPLVESGDYVGVSVGYRLSGEAIWPAQIHDCKAAIRWLRANAKKYNLDPKKIGVTGTSAGGHLVAMLGTSGDVPDLEGKLGDHLKVSSRVQCVVEQRFGPTERLIMGARYHNANPPESNLGGRFRNKKASPDGLPNKLCLERRPAFHFSSTEPKTPLSPSISRSGCMSAQES